MTGQGAIASAKPQRVVHFLSWMKQSGGTENFVMNLYRSIDRSRVQFAFAMYEGAQGKAGVHRPGLSPRPTRVNGGSPAGTGEPCC